MRDPYIVLNVARTASDSEIKATYRTIAKLYHPDRNQGDKLAEQRFKEASDAYKLLGDKDKRRKFDQGIIDANGQPKAPFAAHASRRYAEAQRETDGDGAGGASAHMKSKNPSKGKSESNIFSDILGRNKKVKTTQGLHKGRDLRCRCRITFLEAEGGAQKRVILANGKTLDVKIPPKATDRQILRLRGQGLKGRADDADGDALVELLIEPHPLLRKEGLDVYMDLPLSIPEALKGATITAQTANGRVKVEIPSRANTGTTLRLKKKGLSDALHKKTGNLYIRVIVYLPEETDKDFIGFAESWSERAHYQPRAKFGLFED